MIRLLKLVDKVFKVKESVDDTLEIGGAVVVSDNDADIKHSSWGEEDVPAWFKPLLVPPWVNLQFDSDEINLSDMPDHDPKVIRKT